MTAPNCQAVKNGLVEALYYCSFIHSGIIAQWERICCDVVVGRSWDCVSWKEKLFMKKKSIGDSERAGNIIANRIIHKLISKLHTFKSKIFCDRKKETASTTRLMNIKRGYCVLQFGHRKLERMEFSWYYSEEMKNKRFAFISMSGFARLNSRFSVKFFSGYVTLHHHVT